MNFKTLKYIFCIVFISLTGCAADIPLEVVTLDLNGVEFEIEVAKTHEERQKGLMHRKELGPDNGMLFVFQQDDQLNFWMKNTYIPLSIAYINSKGVIKEIHDMKPLSESGVTASHFVRYALEVNQGRFKELGIEPGYIIDLPESVK